MDDTTSTIAAPPVTTPDLAPRQAWETPELTSLDIEETEKAGTGLDVDMEAS